MAMIIPARYHIPRGATLAQARRFVLLSSAACTATMDVEIIAKSPWLS